MMQQQFSLIEPDLRANEAYGALREGVHIAGYTFERACHRLRALLSDDGWRTCGGGFADVDTFLNSLGLHQFAKVTEERREIAKLIRELRPEISHRAVARALNTPESTLRENRAADEKKANQNNGDVRENRAATIDGAPAAKLVARREERKARDAEAAAARPEIGGDGSFECMHGDFRAVLDDLKDIDAIITDPPYGKEYIPLLRDLAALADRILKPDGIMAVLYGHTYLPEAFAQMTGYRPYRWTACYFEDGNGYVSQARKVQSNWKPILIYGGCEPRFGDVFRSTGDGAAKEHHHWGQNLEAFQSIITALTDPGATVVDPFAGGGTTLIAAKSIGRHAIGAEINADAMVFKLDAA